MRFCTSNYKIGGMERTTFGLWDVFLALYQSTVALSKCSLFKEETGKLAVAITSQKGLFFFLPVMRCQGHAILMSTLPDFQSLRYKSHS